jgi:hypothetical protein
MSSPYLTSERKKSAVNLQAFQDVGKRDGVQAAIAN